MSPRLLNRDTDFRLFMDGEIVEHDDIAPSQRRYQHLLDVGAEGRAVDRSIEHRGGGQLGRAERRDDGVRLPVTARCVIRDAVAAPAPRVAAQQIRRDARFVDEDELPGMMERQRVDPPSPSGGDIRATLFLGVYRFF